MPRKRSSEKLNALKAELWKELGEGNIFEAYIEDEAKRERIYGLSECDKVYLNHAPHVMDTLLHELTHRRFKRWSEKRVLLTASRIIATMDDAEVRRWHKRYQRVAKKGRTVKVD